MRTHLSIAVAAALLLGGCSCDNGGPGRVRRDSGVPPGGDGGPLTDRGFIGPARDTGRPPPMPDPEAFWEDDPPPSICYPDGGMGPRPDPPGGTPECPDDRMREGCPCTTVGETAPCWPGRRVDRMRGICRDGTTTCQPYDEFTGAWGPCMGYVLPMEGATRGPGACDCFSMGRWAIDNLSPCFVTSGSSTYAVSTYVSGGTAMCPAIGMGPPFPPMPGEPWSLNRLTVDCAGQFELCYTLKAGTAMTPMPTDCVVARVCTEGWYPEANVTTEFPPLPGWMGSDSACAAQFAGSGGYGEMSVIGLSIECDDVDDGMGGEYVFNRVQYCPLSCAMTPMAPECAMCMMGGSGMF